MREETETYSWNQEVYEKLLEVMKKGEYMGVGLYHLGTIIHVEKKFESDDSPYIEVIFQIND